MGERLAQPVRDALVVLRRVRLATADRGLVALQRFGKRGAFGLGPRHEDGAIHFRLCSASPGLSLGMRVEGLVLRREAEAAYLCAPVLAALGDCCHVRWTRWFGSSPVSGCATFVPMSKKSAHFPDAGNKKRPSVSARPLIFNT